MPITIDMLAEFVDEGECFGEQDLTGEKEKKEDTNG